MRVSAAPTALVDGGGYVSTFCRWIRASGRLLPSHSPDLGGGFSVGRGFGYLPLFIDLRKTLDFGVFDNKANRCLSLVAGSCSF